MTASPRRRSKSVCELLVVSRFDVINTCYSPPDVVQRIKLEYSICCKKKKIRIKNSICICVTKINDMQCFIKIDLIDVMYKHLKNIVTYEGKSQLKCIVATLWWKTV